MKKLRIVQMLMVAACLDLALSPTADGAAPSELVLSGANALPTASGRISDSHGPAKSLPVLLVSHQFVGLRAFSLDSGDLVHTFDLGLIFANGVDANENTAVVAASNSFLQFNLLTGEAEAEHGNTTANDVERVPGGFIISSGNGRIEQFPPSGGDPICTISGVGGLWVGDGSTIFATVSSGDRFVQDCVDSTTGCGLDTPTDILSVGNFRLVSSFRTDEVLKFDDDGTCAPCVAAGDHGLDGPLGLFMTAPDRFGVVSNLSGQILEYDAITCAFVREIVSGIVRPRFARVVQANDFDCNGNGLPDTWDIADNRSSDANGDGIPDECRKPPLIGDLNCDGTVSVSDINPFVLALTDPSAYAKQFPDCSAQNADCSGDEDVSLADINCFVALLTGE